MGISGNVYSGKQFELFLSLQTGAAIQVNMGTAGAVNGEFVKLDLASITPIDWSGIVQNRELRTGQQIKKPTDHYVSQNGASYTLGFEWVVSHKEGLQKLLQLATEDTASDYDMEGTFSPEVYTDGAATGELATLIISNPNTADDRVFHSAALTELSLSMDVGSNGGRLVASGTFYTGYNPTLGTSSVAPSGAQTTFVKTLHDCTTKQLKEGSTNQDMVMRSFNLNLNYPCIATGSGSNAEAYSRADEITASGSALVKYDGNTDGMIAHFLDGSEKVITVGDGSTINFSLPQVVYTGYNLNLDDAEGAFVEIPFDCVADGAELLYSITVA